LPTIQAILPQALRD